MGSFKKFNKRAFITFGMFTSGIALPVSGLMNHYLAFDILTLSRHFWMSVHNILGILFVVFSVFHIIMNRNAVKNYLFKLKRAFISTEALAAIFIVLFITGLFALHAFVAG
ncbi:MAG TPA: DUF4405 domain-containing protein [Ignavibacteria bacterium]|nr:DUF4405 domain-containing protein [Ignavibacteria bacterium]